MLSLQDLVMRRRSRAGVFELRAPDISLRRGEFVALVGKSGSGKSTLLDVLSLIAPPSAVGRFTLTIRDDVADLDALWAEERDAALSDIRRRSMGYVLQSGALVRFLSVADNVLLPRRMSRLPATRLHALELLARFDVAHLADRHVSTLSGGERQRVAILRALAHEPDIVFADEPTAAVDFDMGRAIVDGLRRMADDLGCAVAMVTHDVDLVSRIADRQIAFMRTDAPDDAESGEPVVAFRAGPPPRERLDEALGRADAGFETDARPR